MLNAILDLSHHNGPVDLSDAKAAGIVGIIHKATQGISYVDSQYSVRKKVATQLGLLWGGYHFGDGTDGAKQASHFLSSAEIDEHSLLVLDIEENTLGDSMTLEQAQAFVLAVHNMTGRWPGIYGGFYLRQLLGGQLDNVLRNCWLWISDYRSLPAPELMANWDDWTLWQYTDGKHGSEPHEVSGIGPCDRDIFNGDAAMLESFWMGAQR